MVLSCSTQLAHMCQSASNITEIVLSSDRLAWGQAQVIRTTCTVHVPTLYMENVYSTLA